MSDRRWLRVLFWSEYYWPYIGGPEVMASRLLPALRARGFRFTVITSQHHLDLPSQVEHEGIRIVRIPFRKAVEGGDVDALGGVIRSVVGIKRKERPDLVHLNGIGSSALFHLRTRAACPAPLLVTLHTRLVTHGQVPRETLQSRVLRAADVVVACSASVRDSLRSPAPDAFRRSVVIPNSLEIPARDPTPLPTDPPHLLCVGRLIPLKGFDLALSALTAIRERYPNVRMTVAGDGPARGALEGMAAKAGLSSAVRFAGWIRPGDIPALIDEATIVLIPSRGREGLPVVAVQAALMGRPIIASRVGGLPEIVLDGVTGLIVEEDDPRGLAKAITELLDHPDTARAMGQRARVHAHERFGWEHHVNAYERTYRGLISNGRLDRASAPL